MVVNYRIPPLTTRPQHEKRFDVTPELTIERNDDGTVSAAYLRIRKGDFARTQEVIPGTVMIDYDENDRIVGIELLQMIEVEKTMNKGKPYDEAAEDAESDRLFDEAQKLTVENVHNVIFDALEGYFANSDTCLSSSEFVIRLDGDERITIAIKIKDAPVDDTPPA